MRKLEQGLGPTKVAESMFAEIDEFTTPGKRVADEFLGGARQNELITVPSAHDASGTVEHGRRSRAWPMCRGVRRVRCGSGCRSMRGRRRAGTAISSGRR